MMLMEKLFEKHMLMNKVKELQKENAELRESCEYYKRVLNKIAYGGIKNDPNKESFRTSVELFAHNALEGWK